MNNEDLEKLLLKMFERYPNCPTPDHEPKKFHYHLMMFLYNEGHLSKNTDVHTTDIVV